jgi:hypothetical protein
MARRPSLPENDIDFGGLRSLAAAEPHKGQNWAHGSLRQNEVSIDPHGAEGPDALQVLIKAPMVPLTICLPGKDGLRPVP